MFIRFNEEAQRILKKAKVEMQNLHHAFIGSEHVILSILNSNSYLNTKLNNYGINYSIYKNELIKSIGIGNTTNNYFIYTPLLKRVLEQAILDTKELNNQEVSIEAIFLAILDEGEGVGIRVLNNMGIDIDKLYDELCIKDMEKKNNKKLLINECGIDLTKKAKDKLIDPLIGRDTEVNEIIEILLRRNKNNPLLIGEAGVGKTAIIEELANRIVNGNIPAKLKNTKIISLSMASCVSGTKYRGEFEERITKMLKELENNKDIIVFIDEIHTLVGAGGAEGAIDAANILKPALARGNIKLIGATTINEYKDTISKDKALNRRFQTVLIKENNLDETKNILRKLKAIYENYHQVHISDEIIDSIVDLSNKYIFDKKNPDKSLDILDMVCAKVSLKENNKQVKMKTLQQELKSMKEEKNKLIIQHHFKDATLLRDNEMKLESEINKLDLNIQKQKRKNVLLQDVVSVIEKKTNIPIYEINNNYSKIKGLKNYLSKKIIGQEKIIDDLYNVTKKIMFGLKSDLPYSMMFVGKSGVGKTMLVKEYSNYLNIPLIRLDMSEYKESHTISKIIGSPPGYIGYNDYDNVLEKVNNNPNCIILLDEIEKACSEVINLFLQILDEGEITNSHGNKVSFHNTIIILTSNIGYESEQIGFNEKNDNQEEIRNILSTAFVNRINKIMYFNSLKIDDIRKIVYNKIKKIITKYDKYNIKIKINNNFVEKIINECDYNIYGARKLNKIIEDKIDNLVIDGIINKESKILIN